MALVMLALWKAGPDSCVLVAVTSLGACSVLIAQAHNPFGRWRHYQISLFN